MKEKFDRSKPHINIGSIGEPEAKARLVSKDYKPSSNDIDITDLLQNENPEFFDSMMRMFQGVPKGFRKPSKRLTINEKRVKKETRKRVKKSRRLNR